MHPIVDPYTSKNVKNIGKLLGNYPKPVVTHFGQPVERVFNSARRGVHINSKELVNTVNNKSQLMTTLQQRGHPVIDFRSLENFQLDGSFDLSKFDHIFGENAVLFITQNGSIYSEGYSDLLRSVAQMKGDFSAVVTRMDMDPFFRGTVTVMPGLIGTNIRSGNLPSGVVEESWPAQFPITKSLHKAAIDIAVSLAADYATVEFEYNEEEALVLDVNTRLQTSTLEPLKAYLRYKTK